MSVELNFSYSAELDSVETVDNLKKINLAWQIWLV